MFALLCFDIGNERWTTSGFLHSSWCEGVPVSLKLDNGTYGASARGKNKERPDGRVLGFGSRFYCSNRLWTMLIVWCFVGLVVF